MSTEKKIFTNDIGVIFKVFAKTDLTTATSLSFEVQKANGALVNWSATLDPTNPYYAYYSAVAGDLDQAGEYLLSLEAVFPGNISVKGESAKFNVYDQFRDV